MSSPKQTPNVAFADALERAKQIAAKLSQNTVRVDPGPTKRPAANSAEEEPEPKKTNTVEAISPQLATLKAQQVAKQINQQLGILRGNDSMSSHSEEIKLSDTGGGGRPVLGRQADIIRRLSEQYGVKMTIMSDPSDPTGEKPIRITGDPEKVARAREAIEQLAAGGSLSGGSMQGIFSEYGNRTDDTGIIQSQFNVPAEKAGIVIGKGGESIKDINRRSGAYVEIDRTQKQGGPGTFRIFNIRGTQEQIMKAQHMIYDKCVNSPGGAPNMVPPPGHPALLAQQQAHYSTTTDLHSYSHYNAAPAAAAPAHLDPYSAWAPQPATFGTYPIQPTWPAFNPEPAWQQTATTGSGSISQGKPAGVDWSTMYPGYYDPQQQQMMPPAAPPAQVPSSGPVVSAPPVTNPQTGQPDYSLAWVEYYRSIGLHAQADFILSHAAQNHLIPQANQADNQLQSNGQQAPSSGGQVPTGAPTPMDPSGVGGALPPATQWQPIQPPPPPPGQQAPPQPNQEQFSGWPGMPNAQPPQQ